VSVEDDLDELWVGVKCQSNTEIAGSPRNALRGSLGNYPSEVEHWLGAGRSRVTKPSQTPNADVMDPGSETAGEKLRRQKEKSPDHQLRSPSAT
jgi:hypothetical protein